ncbi:hypothetical protein HK407_06g10920 [Ordospora pajunii]|uniref:uncharacterized protein n=1 Tax=Ordospora pajunii TaxID=3039483 RepID=UPI0029526258|nr:uncharacterized protein HK407_06g10920 [Ordospora pajunii]KAH9411262.1 hypothetical protein HK407_06g10920 [Ordospora pajunii]
MDTYEVMLGLSKNPRNYTEEYRKQLDMFVSLVNLPNQPDKPIRQVLALLLTHVKIDSRLPDALISSIKTIKCHKIRHMVIESLFLLKRNKLIDADRLLRNLLEYHPDLKSILNRTRRDVSGDAIPCLLEYYAKGNDKQKCFCYYMIVYLFSGGHSELEKDVCEGMFAEGRVGKMCMLYFLDQIDFEDEGSKAMDLLSDEGAGVGKRLFKSIQQEAVDREVKIMKMKVYSLFKSRYGLRASIVPLALDLLNPDKSDIKDVMRLVVGGTTEGDVMKVIGVVNEMLCSEFRDDDYIAYGLNVLRELYCKFDEEARKLKQRDMDMGEEGAFESEEEFESEDASICTNEEHTEESGSKENELRMNELIDSMKDKITNAVSCFKESKSKCVYYAYMSVVNVMNHRKYSGKRPEYVKKKASKEERIAVKRAGLKDKKEMMKERKRGGGKYSKRRRINSMKKAAK